MLSTQALANAADAAATATVKQDTSIRPFPKIHFSQMALNDLRKRIAATQWPEKETVSDSSQGVPRATMRALAPLVVDGLRLAQGRGQAECLAAVRPRHRRRGDSLHPCPVEESQRPRFLEQSSGVP
jgi:hypothetical protein